MGHLVAPPAGGTAAFAGPWLANRIKLGTLSANCGRIRKENTKNMNRITGIVAVAAMLMAPSVAAETTHAHTAHWDGTMLGEVMLYIGDKAVSLGLTGGEVTFDYSNTKTCWSPTVVTWSINSKGGVSGGQVEDNPTVWTIDGLSILGAAGGAWPAFDDTYGIIAEEFTFNVRGPLVVSSALSVIQELVDQGKVNPAVLQQVLDAIDAGAPIEAGFEGGGTAAGVWSLNNGNCDLLEIS